jgi:type IV pilus assembly protein PilX
MSALLHRPTPSSRGRERGYVLATGLLFLVVLTLLGVALFRATGLLDRISANTRDKERSFEAAQSALQYGEWWLQSFGGNGSPCTALVSGQTPATVDVCSNSLSNPGTLPWTAGYTYTPPNLTVLAGGGMASTGGDVNYQSAPVFYIERLGISPDGKSQIYQVTATGAGGAGGTATVVRSTYQITPKTTCLDCQ